MTVAAICLAVLFYTYAGYPLVIALLARLRSAPVARDSSWKPMVSVLIPVYNGAAFVDPKLQSLVDQKWPEGCLEILVFSDGSTDDTVQKLESWRTRYPFVRLLRGPGREGKPSALNRLCAAARGEVVIITDVRQPLSDRSVAALTELLADSRVGCVSGNLVMAGAAGSGAYWRYEKFIRQQEARFRSLIGVSGAIVALRRADYCPLHPATILDDVVIPMRLRLQGRRIVFAQDAQAFDEAFADDREFSRKVRTLAGNYQLLAWMPRLLVPIVNPSWFETFSHRVLRLVCPWALFGLAAGTLWSVGQSRDSSAEQWLREGLILGQGCFYLAALLGSKAGRVGSLARTFVVMNAAALVGFWRFATGRQAVTWKTG